MPTSALEPTAAEQTHPDLARLQGAWLAVAGRRQLELLIAGNRFAARFLDGDIYMGTFALNPYDEPRTMRMSIEEGPPQHRGKCAQCIYQVEGDALRWCAWEPGTDARLAAFPGVDDRRCLSLVLRRERPVQSGRRPEPMAESR